MTGFLNGPPIGRIQQHLLLLLLELNRYRIALNVILGNTEITFSRLLLRLLVRGH